MIDSQLYSCCQKSQELLYPDVLENFEDDVRTVESVELTRDLPVTLLVSENKSASLSSTAYVPSRGKV